MAALTSSSHYLRSTKKKKQTSKTTNRLLSPMLTKGTRATAPASGAGLWMPCTCAFIQWMLHSPGSLLRILFCLRQCKHCHFKTGVHSHSKWDRMLCPRLCKCAVLEGVNTESRGTSPKQTFPGHLRQQPEGQSWLHTQFTIVLTGTLQYSILLIS